MNSTRTVQIGIKTPQQGASFRELRDMWLAADQPGGADDLWLYDHFLEQPGPSPVLVHDAWSTLAALAATTSRAGVGVMVACVTHRPFAALATAAATVADIAPGRLRVGLGAGWSEAEHRALGLPFPAARERVTLLDETCHALRRLLAGDHVAVDGRHVRLDGVRLARAGSLPPFVIGGSGPRMLRLVARHADVWNVTGRDVLRWRARHDELVRACEEVGRPPGEITVSAQVAAPLDDVVATAHVCAYLARSGVGHLVLELDRVARGSEVEELLRAVRAEVARSVGGGAHEVRDSGAAARR